MIKDIYKALVGIALLLYSFIFFIIIVILGFCADSENCTTETYSIQIWFLAYGLIQWVLYGVALKKENTRLLVSLLLLPILMIGLFVVFLYNYPTN